MKILFTIKALDDVQGGAERVLADITSGLADKGHDVSVLNFDQPGGRPFYPLNTKVKRISLGIGNVKRKATFREVLLRMFALRRKAKEIRPDIVIAFMHSSFIPASFALVGTGIPIIASEHIVPQHYHSRKMEYFFLLLSKFFVKKITVLSVSIIQSYPRFLHSKMYAIPNPVHLAQASSYAAKESSGKRVILNVGRLTDQKDQETLIRAFAVLAPNFPDWHLRIIGEGELRDNLENTVSALKLNKRISLPGITSKIEKEYQAAHIFALPSHYESFGLATAEALAHGLPAVGFKSCQGTNELIIHRHNGLLVEDDSRVESLAAALKLLMSDEKLRNKLGKQGFKSIEKFHPDVVVNKWEKLIEEVCGLSKEGVSSRVTEC